MHPVSIAIGFLGGVLVAVLYSIYRAKKFAKLQGEVKDEVNKL